MFKIKHKMKYCGIAAQILHGCVISGTECPVWASVEEHFK